MPRNVLVIGAQGVLGSFIARAFDEAGWHVTRAGRRPGTTPTTRVVDLDRPVTVAEACRGADLVVSTAYHPDLVAESTVLEEGGILVDLVELTGPERTRLRSLRQPRGLVVTDTGVGGVAFLALASLLEQHADADGARYALMLSASGSSGRAGAVFAHSLFTASARHPTGRIPFPEPFGPHRAIEVGGSADSVLPHRIADRPLRHYVCMRPQPLLALLLGMNALGLMKALPKISFTAGRGKVPAEPSDEPICEWVAVTKGDEVLATRTIQGRGSYAMTAAATLVFGEALVGQATRRGVAGVHEVLELGQVREQLRARGIAVDGGGTDDQRVRDLQALEQAVS